MVNPAKPMASLIAAENLILHNCLMLLHPLSPIIDGGVDAVQTVFEDHQGQTANGFAITGFDAELLADAFKKKG